MGRVASFFRLRIPGNHYRGYRILLDKEYSESLGQGSSAFDIGVDWNHPDACRPWRHLSGRFRVLHGPSILVVRALADARGMGTRGAGFVCVHQTKTS